MPTRLIAAATMAATLLLTAATAHAQGCAGGNFAASPGTQATSGINVFNATPHDARLLWVNFDGRLQDYGPVDARDMVEMNTFVGHRWVLELNAPDGRHCVGPVWSTGQSACQVRIVDIGELSVGPGCDMIGG